MFGWAPSQSSTRAFSASISACCVSSSFSLATGVSSLLPAPFSPLALPTLPIAGAACLSAVLCHSFCLKCCEPGLDPLPRTITTLDTDQQEKKYRVSRRCINRSFTTSLLLTRYVLGYTAHGAFVFRSQLIYTSHRQSKGSGCLRGKKTQGNPR